MANKLSPAPIDNDPKPGSDETQKKLRAWISTPTWGAFKVWFDLIYKILKGFTSDSAGNVTLAGDLTVEGSLNGLPPQDYQAAGRLELVTLGNFNKPVVFVTNAVGIASGVFTVIGSVTLAPGTWLLGGGWNFSPAGIANWSAIVIGFFGVGATTTIQTNFLGTLANVPVGPLVVTVTGAGPQTFNIGAQANFSAGSMATQANVWAVPLLVN